MWSLSTCGAWPPNETKKNTHPENIAARFADREELVDGFALLDVEGLGAVEAVRVAEVALPLALEGEDVDDAVQHGAHLIAHTAKHRKQTKGDQCNVYCLYRVEDY